MSDIRVLWQNSCEDKTTITTGRGSRNWAVSHSKKYKEGCASPGIQKMTSASSGNDAETGMCFDGKTGLCLRGKWCRSWARERMQKPGCTVEENYAEMYLSSAENDVEFRLCPVETGRRNHCASGIDVMLLEFPWRPLCETQHVTWGLTILSNNATEKVHKVVDHKYI